MWSMVLVGNTVNLDGKFSFKLYHVWLYYIPFRKIVNSMTHECFSFLTVIWISSFCVLCCSLFPFPTVASPHFPTQIECTLLCPLSIVHYILTVVHFYFLGFWSCSNFCTHDWRFRVKLRSSDERERVLDFLSLLWINKIIG